MTDKNLVHEIVRGCKGSPLALQVIAGSLCQQPFEKWQNMKEFLQSQSILEFYSTTTNLLCLLQQSLDILEDINQKECFMDMGLFPEDQRIPVTFLIDMWEELHNLDEDGTKAMAIINKFPTAVTVQVTKDKQDFNIHLDSSVAAKHGENGSTMAGFDIQNIGQQLAYIVRGETKFKNFKRNKTAVGVSVTFLGENVSVGVKLEDQIASGKRLVLVGSTGTVRSQNDSAYGANVEVRLREADFPVGQDQSSLSLSLVQWRAKTAVRAGLNNKLSGQINVRTSSSDQLQIALIAIFPVAKAIYKNFWPGGKHSDHAPVASVSSSVLTSTSSNASSSVNSHASNIELHMIIDGLLAHYDEIFRLKGVAAKADVFHLFFRSSELLKLLVSQLEPLTEQQLMGITNLQQSSQQAEDALSQSMAAFTKARVAAAVGVSVNAGGWCCCLVAPDAIPFTIATKYSDAIPFAIAIKYSDVIAAKLP
ncbi:hypothetical protein KIW84_058379 [Lathyrus oleraceus]|uniref:Uncharacterized protein n=1 Tax=Pisum sativum TaxID=3888 RepID=A0A9D5AQ59_PEA|nr:hypothetical protein KIW84_058379 [Pisum sativum]